MSARVMEPMPSAADVAYHHIEGFLGGDEADALLAWAAHAVEWRREWVRMFGRTVEVPRRVAWFGDDRVRYRYSGTDHVAVGWPTALEAVRARIQQTCASRFNFVLLNRYRSGCDHMGWHRDDETGVHSRIASLSLGATRRFLIEPEPGAPPVRVDLAHGSLLVLEGTRRHCLPRTRRNVGERINLTFRTLA